MPEITIHCVEKYSKKIVYIMVDDTAYVQDVRAALAAEVKRRVASLLLFEGEDYLQNHVSLSNYEIGDGATLIYESRLCGILPANYDWSNSGLKTKYSRFAVQGYAK
jgi:hypothetical protein